MLARLVRSRALLTPVAYGLRTLLGLTLATCRLQLRGLEAYLEIATCRPCLLALWHGKVAIAPALLHTVARHLSYTAFVSNSRDGRLLAALVSSYPEGGVISVPHDSRHLALKRSIEALSGSPRVVVFTPDGPRGPARFAKQGALVAAAFAAAPVIPFSWHATATTRLPTWDRMELPLPFSSITCTFGKPLIVERDGVAMACQHLEKVLNE